MLRDGDGEAADQDRASDDEVSRVELERGATSSCADIAVEYHGSGRVLDARPRRRAGVIARRILSNRRERQHAGGGCAARVGERQRTEQMLRGHGV